MKTTTAIPAGYAVEPIDTAAASDALMRQLVELRWALDREAVPEDPDQPYAAVERRFRMTSPLFERTKWGAFADGRLVGGVTLVRNFSGSNENLRDVSVNVLPQHRRHGLGRALFAKAVEAVGEGDGILVNGWTGSRVPAGEAFATAVGAKAGLRMRTSQVDLASIDRALMTEWAALDPAGYRLVWIDGDAPEDLMANVIVAYHTMNTMPLENLQMEEWKTTPEIVREHERIRKLRGDERRLLLAIEEATGASAGFTEISFDPQVPHLVWQRGTATVPEHRGKGIGKWMKARMALRVLGEMPAARYIRTGNAGSNAAMLAINHGMGFRLAWENAVWQMPLPDARRYVGR